MGTSSRDCWPEVLTNTRARFQRPAEHARPTGASNRHINTESHARPLGPRAIAAALARSRTEPQGSELVGVGGAAGEGRLAATMTGRACRERLVLPRDLEEELVGHGGRTSARQPPGRCSGSPKIALCQSPQTTHHGEIALRCRKRVRTVFWLRCCSDPHPTSTSHPSSRCTSFNFAAMSISCGQAGRQSPQPTQDVPFRVRAAYSFRARSRSR